MLLTKEQVLADIDALPQPCRTAHLDGLIRDYVRRKADPGPLRPHILTHQQLHRIYFYTALKQMKTPEERMAFIHRNLLFSDWWHTDQLISFVADLDFDLALDHARKYMASGDPFIRRWGYVLFISRLGRGRAEDLLPLTRDDSHYYVQMAQAWLIAELAIFQPEYVHGWLAACGLKYSITGKAVQKICDSFRVSDEWKEAFRSLRPLLRTK